MKASNVIFTQFHFNDDGLRNKESRDKCHYPHLYCLLGSIVAS